MRRVPFDPCLAVTSCGCSRSRSAVVGSQLAHELAYRLVTPGRSPASPRVGADRSCVPGLCAGGPRGLQRARPDRARRRAPPSPERPRNRIISTVRSDVRGAGAGDLRPAGALRAAVPRRCVSLGCMSAADICRGVAASAAAWRSPRISSLGCSCGLSARSGACSSGRFVVGSPVDGLVRPATLLLRSACSRARTRVRLARAPGLLPLIRGGGAVASPVEREGGVHDPADSDGRTGVLRVGRDRGSGAGRGPRGARPRNARLVDAV